MIEIKKTNLNISINDQMIENVIIINYLYSLSGSGTYFLLTGAT